MDRMALLATLIILKLLTGESSAQIEDAAGDTPGFPVLVGRNVYEGVVCEEGDIFAGPTCNTFYMCTTSRTLRKKLVMFSCGPQTMFALNFAVCVHAHPSNCPEAFFGFEQTLPAPLLPLPPAGQLTKPFPKPGQQNQTEVQPVPVSLPGLPEAVSPIPIPVKPGPGKPVTLPGQIGPVQPVPLPSQPEPVSPIPIPVQPGPGKPVPLPGQPEPVSPSPIPILPGTGEPVPLPGQPEPVSPIPIPIQPGPGEPVPLPGQPETVSPIPIPIQPGPGKPVPLPGQPEPVSPIPIPIQPGAGKPVTLPALIGTPSTEGSSSVTFAKPVPPLAFVTKPTGVTPPPLPPSATGPQISGPPAPPPPGIVAGKPLPSPGSNPPGIADGGDFGGDQNPPPSVAQIDVSGGRPIITLPFLDLDGDNSGGSADCPTFKLDESSILNCTKEGRWEHPSDCSKFYQCIHTMDCFIKGFLFQCPRDFNFNRRINTCESVDTLGPCNKLFDDPGPEPFVYPIIQLDLETLNDFNSASIYWDYMPFLPQEEQRILLPTKK